MKNFYLLALALSVGFQPLFSQTAPPKRASTPPTTATGIRTTATAPATAPSPSLFITRLSLRQSFQGRIEKEEAAFLNLVFPEDKESSQNFSFAIGYDLFNPDLSFVSLRPFYEWQKNTQADKEQDVRLAGFSFQAYLWDEIKKRRGWVPLLFSNLNYKDDAVKGVKGTQANLYFTPAFNGKAGRFYPLPDAVNSFSALEFYYNVYTGAELESRVKAKNALEEGTVVRWYTRIVGRFYPLPELLQSRLEIVPDYTVRRALSNGSGVERDHNDIFRLGVSLVLLRKVTSNIADFKIGYDYVNGVDPTKGFDNQRIHIVSFKIRI